MHLNTQIFENSINFNDKNMPNLKAQKDLALLNKLHFCYVCGKGFSKNAPRTRDHVPPKAIFSENDRHNPLILPAHQHCNQSSSYTDKKIGQLVALCHGQHPDETDLLLEIIPLSISNSEHEITGIGDLPLMKIFGKWVRGFHAAIYKEYLADPGGFIYPPFPELPRNQHELQIMNRAAPVRPVLTKIIKEQMHVGRCDSIECYAEKCKYFCTWVEFDNGSPVCIFALRIYDWEELGDRAIASKRGCVGWYPGVPPALATKGTRLHIAIPNFEPLDPFSR